MADYTSRFTGAEIDEAINKTLNLDKTLTIDGYPADAKATGDKMVSAENKIKALENVLIGKEFIAKAEDVENTAEFRQTADGATNGITILDNSYTEVKKIQGDTVKWCGENLIPYPYQNGDSHTHNGITFTAHTDGSITINGTNNSTVHSNYFLGRISLTDGTYSTNGNIISNDKIRFAITGVNNISYFQVIDTDKLDIASQDSEYFLMLQVSPNATINNLTVYPCITTLATPYFADLKNAKISGIKSTGRNLVNIPNQTLKGDGSDWGRVIWTGNLTGDFTLSYSKPFTLDTGAGLLELTVNDSLIYTTYTIDYRNFSGTLTKIRIVNNGKQVGTLSNFMLNFGSTALPFEPYTESIMNLPQETELKKWDYIQDGKIVRQTRIREFNGSEAWTKNENEYGVFFQLYLSDLVLGNGWKTDVISNKYITRYPSTTNNTPFIYFSSQTIYIFPYNETLTTEGQWKTYLASLYANGEPLTIAYKTETSTTTDITFDNQYLVWDKGTEQMQGTNGVMPTITNDYMILGGAE